MNMRLYWRGVQTMSWVVMSFTMILYQFDAEATDSPGVVVKVSKSFTTKVKCLSFMFSDPSNKC